MTRTRDFWSDRRAAVRAEQDAETRAAAARLAKAEQAEAEERSDAEILAELDLPDPDLLAMGDDIRGFMSKAVPVRLRNRALRRLWRLNPVLANLDGLVDYGEDYTIHATAGETLQTTYQVGKGLLAHVEEMARQAAERDNAATVPTPPLDARESEPPQDDAAPALNDDDAVAFDDDRPAEDEQPAAPVPRRMRFDFGPDARRT
ncbi:DUF3306 domain-containing protein [Sedimentitalea sp. JM2-8]|uniref:DUF3306 domain-containing protein n=1 Tax=Sedimentitalea xiamensis TaxID=3050037 RepID=A0ABT7FDT8_9RHOB|nr:DUF3306 domain-containing protein [Sedimentitalea xiamensis]MDK3072989.1 DUF3306 domain-containing protein [Sedimentitalea xiamensis]